MDYLQHAFYESSGWDVNNSYPSLNATAQCQSHFHRYRNIADRNSIALLFFDTPKGIRLNVSSLSSPNSATSYDFGSVGFVNGSMSYLYSSLPLRQASSSRDVNLRNVIQGYRHVQELRKPDDSWAYQLWHKGARVDKKGISLS